MDDTPPLEIILGTYEEYLLGYKFFPKSLELKQTFTTHSHSSSIRSVCVSNKYLASGGADDRIFVYDLVHRKEHCVLTHHNSTVNCLAFTPDNTHLLSGSADGVLAVVRVGNWQLEKIWEKAHKGSAILDIAVHSSGKLALTLGADRTLCTWNLVKGRQAYITNLNSKSKDAKSLEHITWALCGIRFVIYGGKYTEIWSIEKGGILSSIEHSNKVTCCSWISNDSFVVGYENGKLGMVNSDNQTIKVFEGHSNSRVKCMTFFKPYVITASSSGNVKIWDNTLKKNLHKCSSDCKCNSGCRITSICVTAFQDVLKNEDSSSQSDSEDETTIQNNTKKSTVEVIRESDSENEIEVIPKKKVRKHNK